MDDKDNISKIYRDFLLNESTKINSLDSSKNHYSDILSIFQNGHSTVEYKKRFLLKAIDETWVRAVEDSIDALDTVIRNPARFIIEQDKVLPIEQSKKISNRSIQDLCQHTEYIKYADDDKIIPSKLLNVFNEETLQTYENKFVNTLIRRLFYFVKLRYDTAVEKGKDEKITTVNLEQKFEYEDKKGTVNIKIELSEPPKENELIRNHIYSKDLFSRVEKIYNICKCYYYSDFVKEMNSSFIRPPLIHTNAILKNPNYRQCLALWQFIEGYENAGHEMLVEENLYNPGDEFIKGIYSTVALQYYLFRKLANEETEEIESVIHDKIIMPEIKDKIGQIDESEFDVEHEKEKDEPLNEEDIITSIEVALSADELIRGETTPPAEKTDFSVFTYKHSFMSRYIRAQDPLQSYYTEIKNYLLGYKKVKCTTSWNFESFSIGRKKYAKMNVKGKTLLLFLSLNPSLITDRKYRVIDSSNIKRYSDVPACIKVRSERGKKYALELIRLMFDSYSVEMSENLPNVDYHTPLLTIREMLDLPTPLVKEIYKKGTRSGNNKAKYDFNSLKSNGMPVADAEDKSSVGPIDEIKEAKPDTVLSDNADNTSDLKPELYNADLADTDSQGAEVQSTEAQQPSEPQVAELQDTEVKSSEPQSSEFQNTEQPSEPQVAELQDTENGPATAITDQKTYTKSLAVKHKYPCWRSYEKHQGRKRFKNKQ